LPSASPILLPELDIFLEEPETYLMKGPHFLDCTQHVRTRVNREREERMLC